MKNKLFIFALLFLAIVGFSSELIESYRLTDRNLNEEIYLGKFEIMAYGNQFSIEEWWQEQPRITLEYEGEEILLEEIKTVLQNIGFVLGEGKSFYVKTERLQERFIYIETAYDSRGINNMDSLFIFSENNEPQLEDFFQNAFGNYSKSLPKLVLIHTEHFFNFNGEILYRGPEYSVIKLFDEQLKITMDNRNMEFDIPFYPVLYLDLTQKQFLLNVETNDPQTIFIDGEKFTAPVRVYLDEGVHEIEFANHSQYIYLKNDMVISLDNIKKAELTINLNVPAQILLMKDEEIVESLQSQNEKFELIPGEYKLVVENKEYKLYEESFQLSSAQQIKKDIVLVEKPGTVIYRMDLSRAYKDVFFEDKRAILTNSEESLLIDIENELISAIDSKVVWFDGNIIVADNSITNWAHKTLYSGTSMIINAVKIQHSLWLFTSDKKVISLDMNTWEAQWRRVVNYTPYKIITTENYIGVLDVYSRVILINTELGYRDYLDMRIPGITGINFLEQTEEKISINLQNYEGCIDYYFKSKSTDLRKKEAEKLHTEFKQSGNVLYQDENPLVTLSGGVLIKIITKKNHLAILTDEEMVVCTAY
ncbi:MAG: hypothetical protein U9N62_00045 [Thermotogota bacterium]|nr:hypothetical protein [Thermotogota bacterium]